MRSEYVQQIIQEIEKRPLSCKEFTRIYDLNIPEAQFLFPKYLTLCKDGIIRIQKIKIA